LRVRKDRRREEGDPVFVRPPELLGVTVAQVLKRKPCAAGVLLRLGMACPGCPFASFETVQDVANAYGLDAAELAESLFAARAAGINEELTQ
jgi:hybrid cluster-associated redox disulfide protein